MCLRHRPVLARGSALIITMIFLVLFATLAIAFASATSMNLRLADNTRKFSQARMTAESGLGFMIGRLRALQLPADAEQDILTVVAIALADEMDGTPNLGTALVDYDGETITIPPITVNAEGLAFSVTIRSAGSDRLLVVSTCGHDGAASRLGLEVEARTTRSAVFDYGIATRSKITMTGNARVTHVNDPSEASILSATYSDQEAVRLTGNPTVSGYIATSNPDSHVTIIGNPSVGGSSSWTEIQEHIHIGVGEVEFPQIDTSVFEPFATNIVNSSTQTNGNRTFENIRVKAGTNPTFTGNTTIRGVVYIESPNRVTFAGNLSMTGVIVTEDAGEGAHTTNTISFTGNFSSSGVEALPAQPQFAQLRQMPGSMLLAPGFGVSFSGNFGTVNGAMAADRFAFVGNAGGTVRGSIICYSDTEFSLTGNSHFRFDRSQYGHNLPGFRPSLRLNPVANSYTEF